MPNQSHFNCCYAFIGTKGSGKDTLANLVTSQYPDFISLKFAEPLKSLCHQVFDLSSEQLEDAKLKETSISPIYIDRYLPQLCEATNLPLESRGLVATTPRQLLQYVGTNYIRAIQDDYWVRRMAARITEAGNRNILITDCRFRNEAEILRQLGFSLIRINKVGWPEPASQDQHISELEISQIEVDYGVNNVYGDMLSLQSFVQEWFTPRP